MRPSRFLPIANLIGCLLITGLIVTQWLREQRLQERIKSLDNQLVANTEQLASEKSRTISLEKDIAQLKESIEASVAAKKESEEAMAKLVAERDAATANAGQAAIEQTKAWEAAIAERDGKIRELGESLNASRARLNEAIARLKEAGAR